MYRRLRFSSLVITSNNCRHSLYRVAENKCKKIKFELKRMFCISINIGCAVKFYDNNRIRFFHLTHLFFLMSNVVSFWNCFVKDNAKLFDCSMFVDMLRQGKLSGSMNLGMKEIVQEENVSLTRQKLQGHQEFNRPRVSMR